MRYLQLLNRQQELSISKSSAIGNVRIINTAVTQPQPVKPKKALNVVLGFILGLFISVGAVLARAMSCGRTSPGTTGRARHQRLCHYPNVRVAG